MKFKKFLIAAVCIGAVNFFANAVEAEESMKSDFRPVNALGLGEYDLEFNPIGFDSRTAEIDGKSISFRAYENIVYVKNPKNAQYQSLNIYIPQNYIDGKSINGYTSKTAPIFMPTGVGGYMPSLAQTPDDRMGGSTILKALERGYVVVSPAIRGRTTVADSNSNLYVGKAPAFVVDFKAAVRFLRANRDRLPAGDVEKIISNGTSAGGALSALLGATGNAPDYEKYLREIGAAQECDDIFASSDYCPITNLDHADAAYEWIFHDVLEAHQSNRQAPPPDMKNPPPDDSKKDRPMNVPVENQSATPLTEIEQKVSDILRAEFPIYVNSLGLKDPSTGELLLLDANGEGSFKNFVKSKYIESAQDALNSGESLKDLDWIVLEGKKVVDVDLDKYAVYATRMKAPPAFDKLDLSSGENDEFATESNEPRHFTRTSKIHETKSGEIADADQIRLMNPMNFIGREDVQAAKHFRIRHGAIDRDTSLAIPSILALKLMNSGIDVDFYSPWNRGHAGDYDLPELFDWIDSICK